MKVGESHGGSLGDVFTYVYNAGSHGRLEQIEGHGLLMVACMWS